MYEMNEMNELHGCISIAGVKFGSWYGHTYFLKQPMAKVNTTCLAMMMLENFFSSLQIITSPFRFAL